jgi:broad specificity phosphatase PhoE
VRFDAVYVGSLRRQRETVEEVASVYAEAGLAWPDARVIEGLNEHAGLLVFQQALPILMERDATIRETFTAIAEGREASREVGLRAFMEAMRMWSEGEIVVEGVGVYRDFVEGVRKTLSLIREEQGHGKQIAAFSSAGTISTAIGLCCRLEEREMMELSWKLRNASLSEIAFSDERLGMVSFNATPHLHKPHLISLV